ncbi:hypothetical protein [Bacillus licheniformis]|uniref:hypothetical protein n=1 Tax=Bacillus licheniformis TaxID=1402 RepID=UPI000FF8D573|nr:hypothetical protein [Bacillus licheniformis]MEC5231980.1 hypothetical protein [Bacillus licheniformis]QAS15148.1 hypothetical protein EQJ69_04205 [Bacillus licheniformis]
MLKILSVEEFKKIKRNGVGYVVIIDKPNATCTLHRSNCPHVDQKNFFQKVIENKEVNGSYYSFEDKLSALNELDAKECLVCKG